MWEAFGAAALKEQIGTVAVALGLLVLVISGLANRWADLGLRVGGVFLILGLSLFADDTIVYIFAVLFIATIVTKLEFIENIVALIRGQKETWPYRTEALQASRRTVDKKLDNEVEEAGDVPEENRKKAREAAGEFEVTGLRALVGPGGPLEHSQTWTNIELIVPWGRSVVDAVIRQSNVDYIVEFKHINNARTRKIGYQQLMHRMREWQEGLQQVGNAQLVRGLLVLARPKGTDLEVRGGNAGEIFTIIVDPESGQLQGRKHLEHWLSNPETPGL